ncbi:MAG: hypothetical protein EOO03_12115 [Chitinophagaceae bacterium]|nr:MAG: hypothetical protein EOO03_12115 [Chitinophagaceae bacterium]
MQRIKFLFIGLALIVCSKQMMAQPGASSNNNLKTYRVGIFAPLYLDSVFNEIGKTLNEGYSPTTKQIYYASYYVSTLLNDNEK